jgi:hypothetical protein
MKTSWNETRQIEKLILGLHNTGDALLFEAKLILDNDLSNQIHWQQKTYEAIQTYSRRQLKKEIEAVHHKLFTQSSYTGFSQKIRRLFINK